MKLTPEEKEFFDRLANELENLFPKTNQDNPEIQSEGNRTTALVFNAKANIIFGDILHRAIHSREQKLIEKVIEILEESKNQVDGGGNGRRILAQAIIKIKEIK